MIKKSITITHLGAKTCVTGSCHLIQFQPDHGGDSIAILVDCGIAQGHDPQVSFDRFPVPPADIDFLFLTHAHIDHIGRVPDLIDAGFCGEIICTHGTKALLLPMLRDAMSFSDRTDAQIRAMEEKIDDLSWGFELCESFTLKHNIAFTLKNAGHILGSCFIQFSFPNPDGSVYRVTFSGDLGSKHTPILPDPDPPDACDLLVLESTYGDRNHENRADRQATLAKTLDHALSDSGIVYIPAFALDRTQELIYELDRINPGVPVFIDSPLGIRITRLYQDMDDCWDREAKALKAAGDHPIRFKHLYAVEKFQDHRRLLHLKGPAVIIAGSGMCTGGRIVNHLKHGLGDPKNDLFFVGYQAKGTSGRAIVECLTPAKASIHHLSGYSAHADQQTLCDWVKSMPEPPGGIKLVHGEPEVQKVLRSELKHLLMTVY
jgi:metallo-beta-lactamase family protein